MTQSFIGGIVLKKLPMKKNTINPAFASQIVEAALMFVDFPGTLSAVLGVKHQDTENNVGLWQYQQGIPSFKAAQEVSDYLYDSETKLVKGSGRLISGTPHFISGVKVADFIIAAKTSIPDPWDIPIAVVYGHFHEIKQRYPTEWNDQIIDMLLLHISEWVNQNPGIDSVEIRKLASMAFKPEMMSIH